MARTATLLALFIAIFCGASTVASGARFLKPGFVVRGRVFCDPCRAGFETPATTYMAGAKVRIECRDRTSEELKYSTEGITDATGTYSILVADEHENQICESVLLGSSQASCKEAIQGRDRARVVLTHNNGIPSNVRLANSMGYLQDTISGSCAEVMKMYQLDEEEN